MFKKIWFQIHWFIGITAGTILMLIGVTGATLAFREELLNVFNPGMMHVAASNQPLLTPQQIIDQVHLSHPERRITSINLSATPGTSPRIIFAPPPSVRRGEARYVNPYTAEVFPAPTAGEFFEVTERLHRWLLLPVEIGKIVLGTLALCLLILALSGLYLRWPRRPLSLQAWFRLDFKLTGRSFLWNLHSIIGTCALIMYVIFTTTGMYWSFDWFKQGVNTLVGEAAPARAAPPAGGRPQGQGNQGGRKDKEKTQEKNTEEEKPLNLDLAWASFLRESGGYDEASLRLPDRSGKTMQVLYLAHGAPHERARSRMVIQLQNGEVKQSERYSDKGLSGKFLAAIYPLHMGTYFGLPGRIIMAIAALILPLFGITGWMLYLDRRRKKRLLRAERAALQETVTAPLRPGKISATGAAAATPQDSSPLLIAFASQAGQAEQLALKTAALMRQAGAEVTLQSLARLNPERLRHHHRILFIVSTFGEGDAPDSARAFAKRMQFESGEALAHVEYAMLALGDRNYVKFCGFGHTLDHWLRNRGAHAAFPMVEVDRMDKAALQVWQHGLSGWIGYRADSADAPHSAAEIDSDAFSVDLSDDGEAYSAWQLSERLLLNNGSLGQPIFHLELRPEDGHAAQWKSGALVEILPRHAPDRVEALLRRWQLDGEIGVTYAGRPCTLSAALARSVLPVTYHLEGDPRTQAQIVAQALTNSLQALSPRRYSIASIPQDGAVHLLVRQVSHEDGLGLASGWLTEYAPLGGALDLRILPNRSFELACAEHQETEDVADSAAAIFIGNGSGLAGLRSHLRERMRRGEPRNWLLFGERNRRFDYLYQAEIEQWQHSGMLERVDLAFSRDQTERIYVQDKLREAGDAIREWVRDGAVLYVCGSLDGMAAGVDAALEEVLGQSGVEDLIAANRYRRDVY